MLNGNRHVRNGKTYHEGNCKDCGVDYSVRSDYVKTHLGYCRKCAYIHIDFSKESKILCKNLYRKYNDMKSRCYNKKRSNYSRYGGRGISICGEWLDSFLSFQEWSFSNGYKKGLTIDRIDNDGNYEPRNCRWIPMVENTVKDRRILNSEQRAEIRSRLLKGETKTNLSNEFGVSYQVIHYISKTKEIL